MRVCRHVRGYACARQYISVSQPDRPQAGVAAGTNKQLNSAYMLKVNALHATWQAMLLKYGANPNFRGADGTLLHQAMQRLPAVLPISFLDTSHLHIELRRRRHDVAATLILLPTNQDAENKWEGTAVELLLRWGADPSIPGPHGWLRCWMREVWLVVGWCVSRARLV